MSLDETISARTARFVESTLAVDASKVGARLAGERITVALDPDVATSFAGQMILFTLLNLLVRLDRFAPQLDVTLPSIERHALLRLLPNGTLAEGLEYFFAPFPAARRLHFHSRPGSGSMPSLRVVISPQSSADSLQVWADGWITYLNTTAPFRPEVANAVGACVAADFAAAEVFKHLIAGLPLRPGLKMLPIQQLVFSAYDYGLAAGANPALPPQLNVDGVVVVGLGGIGAGFVAAASALPGLAGLLTLVDKDVLDPTNLNRLLYARPGDTGYKVDLCRRALSFQAAVDAQVAWFDEFTVSHGTQHDLVVVGVDKDPIRRAIQESMPRLVFNGGTSDVASFQVTRHDYLHGACLACIAPEMPETHPADRELARQLGLSLETVLQYQASGAAVPAALLRAAGTLGDAGIERLGDHPLTEIQARVCAEMPLCVGPQEEAVSISFLSALPGFLLLGEVIKERCYGHAPRVPLNTTSNRLLLSLLGRPRAELLRTWWQKMPGCDCGRSTFASHYRRKWGAAAEGHRTTR